MLYLFGAKKMQTSAKKACFQFAKCSFSSAKKMQTSAKKTCFQFAECSFSSAKIRLSLLTSKVLGENVGMGIKKKKATLGLEESRLLNIVVSMMKQRIIYSLLISSICFIISSLVFCIFRYIHHAATTPMKAPVPPP